MSKAIRQAVRARRITRLCHFTQVSSLSGILGQRALLSSDEAARRRLKISVNDRFRQDRHLDHVCCSVQYPNLYLLNRYRETTGSAVDWVVLLISPTLLELSSTLYSPVNAATGSGVHVGDGITGFNQMFMSQPPAKAHQVRTSTHLASCPTSLQAEVLVHRSISASEVVGVVVESDDVIDRVRPFLEKFGRPAPTVYSKFRFFETNFVQTRIELGYEIDLGTRRN